MQDFDNLPVPSRGDGRRRVDPEEAWSLWAGMGPTRSYSAVAKELGVADSTILRLARKGGWDRRLAQLEKPVREDEEKKLQVAIREMNDRYLSIAKGLAEKGAEALAYLVPDSVPQALKMIDLAAKLERQALGEPDSKKVVTIEQVLRERFEALVVHEEGPREVEAIERPRLTIDVPDLGDEDDDADEGYEELDSQEPPSKPLSEHPSKERTGSMFDALRQPKDGDE